MKKATKGALAAAAAGSLLVGGAGSLAYWTDSSDVTGATISSGQISMGALDCSTAPLHGWEFADAAPLGSLEVVPGDSLSKVCEFDLTLEGHNIAADLAIVTPSFTSTNGLIDELDLDADFAVTDSNGDPVTDLDEAGVYTVQVTINVDFPRGDPANDPADNDSQDETAVLNDVTVTATQV